MTSNLLEELIKSPQELDYVYLTSMYQDKSSPRKKIQYLLQRGDLMRNKKGLYVLGEKYAKRFSRFVLSNMIYGPSYVSAESALSYYGFIPERVEAVTAVCTEKKKQFETPVGRFIYYFSSPRDYAIGITRQVVDKKRAFLVASPEKALYDLLRYRKGMVQKDDIQDTIEHLRLADDELHRFDLGVLHELAQNSSHKKIAHGILEYIAAKGS